MSGQGRVIDISGQIFGRLKVVERTLSDKHGGAKWLCLCECGAVKEITRAALTRGTTVSCGCHRLEAMRSGRLLVKHGKHGSPEYLSWRSMRDRCSNPKSTSWKYYGERGISVCERWSSFDAFLADMGPRPSLSYSLDRYPNKDGNYELGNCRWATGKEQANNRRRRVAKRKVAA